MHIKPKTIFSKISHTYSGKTDKKTEDSKVSYWLKKLFDQRAQKIIHDKELADSKLVSQLNHAENNAHRQNLRENSSKQKGHENAQANSDINARNKRLTEEMVRKSNREVYAISSVFPWDIFPSTIRIQENKVSFIFHQIFTSQEQDVDIKDISNTHLEQGFLFARLKILSNVFQNQPVVIDHLRKREAQLARMYIQGLQLFCQKNIDTSNYEIAELKQKLEELQTQKYY